MTLVLPGRRARMSNVLFRFAAADCVDEQGMFALSYGERVAAVLTRTARKSLIGANGRLFTIAAGAPSLMSRGGRIAMLHEPERRNLCLRSEDFGLVWATTGSGSRVAAAHTASGVTLDLLDDTDAAASANWYQTIAFTGDGEKAFLFHIKQGTSATTIIKLRSVGVADRGRASVVWTAGVPAVTASVGTLHEVVPLADGVYEVLMSAPGVVAAETNQLQVYPTSDGNAALTGSVYAGGMQAENAAVPSSYMRTDGAAFTRQSDTLYFPFSARPQAMTIYVRGTERGTRFEPGSYVWQISQTNNNPRVHVNRTMAAALMQFQTVSAAGGFSTAPRAAGADTVVGDLVEYRSVLSATGALRLGVALNAGDEQLSNLFAGTPLESTWSGQRLWIGTNGAGGVGLFAFTHLLVAAGEQSLAAMRELAGV